MELTLDQALQKGVEAHKAGKAQEADRYYTAILKVDPKHPDANHNMGVLAVGVGKVTEALPFFKTALEVNPKIDQYWLSYIDALIRLERFADAEALVRQAKSKGLSGEGFDQIEKNLNERKKPTSLGDIKPQDPPRDLLKSLMKSYAEQKLHRVFQEDYVLQEESIHHEFVIYILVISNEYQLLYQLKNFQLELLFYNLDRYRLV